jgi:uncharacterized protein (TIGR00255 family)
MSLVSMTGFAEAQGCIPGAHWRWEVKSVNGRGLDLRLRLPPGFDGLEAQARILAAGRFKRGNLQISLAFEKEAGAQGLRVDRAALAAAVNLARELASETGLPAARIDGLLALKGVIVQEEAEILTETEKAARDGALLESLDAAFAALAVARGAEGAKLAAVLSAQMDEIARLTEAAAVLAATQPAALRDKLMRQLADLIAPGAVQPDRLEQEVALLAVRADVREELDRLKAHTVEARRLMASGEAVGRKLDFLAQEFNREANTLCSKSSDTELTRVGIELKSVIDQFREQSANVE